MSEAKVNETKPSEMKPKKMVRRSVAVALGIICILLAVGLSGLFAYYVTFMNSEVADKNNTISNLDAQITALHSQLDDINATANLGKSTSWATDLLLSDSTYNGWETYKNASYAGYVFVVITSSSSFNARVYLSFSLPNGITYDKAVFLDSTQNTTWFPVLPALIFFQVIESTHASVHVTVTYYY